MDSSARTVLHLKRQNENDKKMQEIFSQSIKNEGKIDNSEVFFV